MTLGLDETARTSVQTSPGDDALYTIICLLEGDGLSNVFLVSLAANKRIFDMKHLMFPLCIPESLSNAILVEDLILFKVGDILDSNTGLSLSLRQVNILLDSKDHYLKQDLDLEQLDPAHRVSHYWPDPPNSSAVNVFVKLSSNALRSFESEHRPSKRRRVDFGSPLTALQPTERCNRTFLLESQTVYRTESGIASLTSANTPNRLPSLGDGFLKITTTPGVIAVDKTAYIEELDKEFKYHYVFLRPPGFGKTTTLQMLACYYDKKLKAQFDVIFGNLYIGEHPTQAASSLLVLCFDFSKIMVSDSYEETKRSFSSHIYLATSAFLYENSEFLEPYNESELLREHNGALSLEGVLRLVKISGQLLFVGVDEYDAPFRTALVSPNPDRYRSIMELFRAEFFAVIKHASSNGIVRKYWLTGVLPAFRDWDGPLNATHLSTKQKFHGFCGLTDEEVNTITQAYLSSVPRTHDVVTVMHQLQQWCSGYNFCKTSDRGGSIVPLYNSQLVFKHLGRLAVGKFTQPQEELEAIHIASVLNVEPAEGDLPLSDIFLRIASSRLDAEVKPRLPFLQEISGPNSDSWIKHTLLYYFGVFVYVEGRYLGITNKTMKHVISNRFLRFLDGNKSISPSLFESAVVGLRGGDVQPLVNLLETFFKTLLFQSIRYMNEDALQLTLGSFLTFGSDHQIISDLCLLAEPFTTLEQDRCDLLDLFVLGAGCVSCLELRNVSLADLWRGLGNENEWDIDGLGNLRDELEKEDKHALLQRTVKYQTKANYVWVWQQTTIEAIREVAFQKIERYLRTIKEGVSDGKHQGIKDFRVRCSEGTSCLFGYVIICVGGTRILAWKVKAQESAYLFELA